MNKITLSLLLFSLVTVIAVPTMVDAFGDELPTTPFDIATNSTGHMFGVDTGNHRVLVYDSTGKYLDTFGKFGSASGEFNVPISIVVDSKDRLIIADTENNRIQIFNSSNYSQITEFGGVAKPEGVGTNSTDHIFVADTGTQRIAIFDKDGNNLQVLTENFPRVRGVAVDSAQKILVVDALTHTLKIFTSIYDTSPTVFGNNGNAGSNANQFGGPSDIAYDSTNNRYIVADTGIDRIKIINSDGSNFNIIGKTDPGTGAPIPGSGNGEFDEPSGVTLDSANDRIIVADTLNNRFQVFDLDGVYQFSIPLPTNSQTVPLDEQKKGGSGCSGDCTPPTVGVDTSGKRLVDDGFSYNGNAVDAELFFTPYPLVTVDVGAPNVATFKIYDNQGPDNISHFDLAFGLSKGETLQESKARIEWDRSFDGTQTVTLIDPENALQNISVTTQNGKCTSDAADEEGCLILSINHTFREKLDFNIVASNVWDTKRNAWQNYYNHGIEVVGDSMNPPAEYYGIYKGQITHLIETGKNVAIDGEGNTWSFNNTWQKDWVAVSPIVDSPTDVMTRTHSEFNVIKDEQILVAIKELETLCPTCLLPSYYDFEDSFAYEFPTLYENKVDNPELLKLLKSEALRAQNTLNTSDSFYHYKHSQ